MAGFRAPFELALRHRWNEGIAVDLPMWMVQRYPNLLAAIFEDVDVVHVVPAAQRLIAVGPYLDKPFQRGGRQACE
jgi:hypothetical protein